MFHHVDGSEALTNKTIMSVEGAAATKGGGVRESRCPPCREAFKIWVSGPGARRQRQRQRRRQKIQLFSKKRRPRQTSHAQTAIFNKKGACGKPHTQKHFFSKKRRLWQASHAKQELFQMYFNFWADIGAFLHRYRCMLFSISVGFIYLKSRILKKLPWTCIYIYIYWYLYIY